MIITIDIGNSRIKWAGWREGGIISRGAGRHVGEVLSDEFFRQLFSGLVVSGSGDSARLSLRLFAVCVADRGVRQALDQWVEKNWLLSIDYLQTKKHYKGITHAYADPLQHGADRWAALIAGQRMSAGVPLCVICAGTAITFDFLDQSSQHLGGYILPSYRSMHKALTADTSNVISVAEVFENEGVGDDRNGNDGNMVNSFPANTNDSVNAGLHRLLRSGIRDICATGVKGGDDAMWQIVITGGGAEELMRYPDMPVMRYEPDLVMQGVYEVFCHENGEIRQPV